MKVIKFGLLMAVLVLTAQDMFGQVTGGQSAFEYLRMANSPHVSALGGISVANPENDISFVVQNPALMRPGLHDEISLNYNSFYADVSALNLQYGYHIPKINTSFFTAIQYLNYGTFTATDDVGNTKGDFRAADYNFVIGASKKYLDHWRYGADIKMAISSLYSGYASALLVDVGVNYYDTASLFDFGMSAKNMGSMLQKYNDANGNEPLPFDLQIGISKKFRHMPLRLFATAHHLYEWDIRYDNPDDRITTNIIGTTDTNKSTSQHLGDKLFRHFIFGAELSLGQRLVLSGSYNFLRRKELALTTKTGLAGFAFGVNLNFDKLQIHYGRTYYHIAGPVNEIGLNMTLHKFIPAGKRGAKLHWNAEYPDWD